ncbi:MAG: c-type cytochrome [Burkholderiales bacterium]
MAEGRRGWKIGEKVLFGIFGVFVLLAGIGFYFMDAAVQKHPAMFKMTTHYNLSAEGQEGSSIFLKQGCTDCHRAIQDGTNSGLSLDGEGSKRDVKWIYAFLKHPEQTYGATTIDHRDPPAAAAYVASLPDDKIHALAVFLSELTADRGSTSAEMPPEAHDGFIDKMVGLWAPDSWKGKFRDIRKEGNQ